MKLPIPYGRHHITPEDIEQVLSALNSEFITQGPRVTQLEKSFAERMGATYAVAVANGTAALHLAYLSLNPSPGDKVITSPLTFVASANCVLYGGGDIQFVDIDPQTYLLDINKLEKILRNSPVNTYKGIIPINFAGMPFRGDKLRALANEFNLWVIEDASHSPGAGFTDDMGKYHRTGGHHFSDLTTYSFHPVKHIAAGEGGMITTHNKEIYERLLLLRSHGIVRDSSQFEFTNQGAWYHEMQILGFNYRLSDIQAALANSQLSRLSAKIEKRIYLADRYTQALKNLPLTLPQIPPLTDHAYHLFVIQTQKRDQLYQFLHEKKILAQIHYLPVHLHPFYQKRGFKNGDFPIAEDYYRHCLSLPLFDSLETEEQDYIIDSLNEFFIKN